MPSLTKDGYSAMIHTAAEQLTDKGLFVDSTDCWASNMTHIKRGPNVVEMKEQLDRMMILVCELQQKVYELENK